MIDDIVAQNQRGTFAWLDESSLDAYEHRVLFKIAVTQKRQLVLQSGANVAKNCMMSLGKYRECIKSLLAKELIREKPRLTPRKIYEILKQKTPQKIQGTSLKCEWCLSETFALQEHHFPIPRSEGGNQTVFICGSCHSEFHCLEQTPQFELTFCPSLFVD